MVRPRFTMIPLPSSTEYPPAPAHFSPPPPSPPIQQYSLASQVRYLTRIVTPDDYDMAVRLRPETCPMYYMGDRRTGRQLLDEADTDAAITVAALARHLETAGGGCEGMSRESLDPGVGCSGYMQACGGRGLLEGIARAVGWLAIFLESAGPASVGFDAWVRAVRDVSATLCVPCCCTHLS
jgi:hypothetical protein